MKQNFVASSFSHLKIQKIYFSVSFFFNFKQVNAHWVCFNLSAQTNSKGVLDYFPNFEIMQSLPWLSLIHILYSTWTNNVTVRSSQCVRLTIVKHRGDVLSKLLTHR